MYVLFIPSFPNNRFHLGNIRNNSKQKEKKRRKKEDEQEAEVQSLRYKPIAHIVQFDVFANIFVNFCLIFCFYILYDNTRVTLIRVCLSLTKTFVSFRFLSFLRFFFLGNHRKVSLLETCRNGSDLSYSLFWVLQLQGNNTWRFAPHRRFVCFSVTWFYLCFFFLRLEFRLTIFFSNFRAKVIRLLLALQKEKCVLLRTFVPV